MAACLLVLCGLAFDDPLSTTELQHIGRPDDFRLRRSRVVASPTAQDILELTDFQKADVQLLQVKINEENVQGQRRLEGRVAVDDERGFVLTFDENDRGVDELLNPEQRKVLGRIHLQCLGREAPLRIKSVARHLGISDAQVEDYDRRTQASTAAVALGIKGFKSSEDEEKYVTRMKSLLAQHRVELTDVLNEHQRRKLDQLLFGERQTVDRINAELHRMYRFFRHGNNESPIQSVMGDFLGPFRLLFIDDFLAHLEVTPKQREELVELVNKERRECADLERKAGNPFRWNYDEVGFEHAGKLRSRISAFWIVLSGILDERQIRRYHEVRLQSFSFNELFNDTEAARKLGVTQEQVQRASAIMKRDSDERIMQIRDGKPRTDRRSTLDKMSEVLTQEQKDGFKKMQGEPIGPQLLTKLKRTRNMIDSDRYGIPTYGIGAKR